MADGKSKVKTRELMKKLKTSAEESSESSSGSSSDDDSDQSGKASSSGSELDAKKPEVAKEIPGISRQGNRVEEMAAVGHGRRSSSESSSQNEEAESKKMKERSSEGSINSKARQSDGESEEKKRSDHRKKRRRKDHPDSSNEQKRIRSAEVRGNVKVDIDHRKSNRDKNSPHHRSGEVRIPSDDQNRDRNRERYTRDEKHHRKEKSDKMIHHSREGYSHGERDRGAESRETNRRNRDKEQERIHSNVKDRGERRLREDDRDERRRGQQFDDRRQKSSSYREGERKRDSGQGHSGAGKMHVREWDRGKEQDERGEIQPRNNNKEQDGENPDAENQVAKEEPNFELSGKLTEFTNTYKGVVIKYNEPPEARIPKARWRLYPFKGDESLSVLHIHRQSAYLLGRNRMIADIPVDHPSCSSQHAVLQYRLVDYKKPDGSFGRKVKPYIIDLDSSNGTFLNNNKIDSRRYFELKEKDVLKFGFSSREYVILHDQSKDDPKEESENESEGK